MENREIIESLLHEIVFGDRRAKVRAIIEYSGDEYESKEDYLKLAECTEYQINNILADLIKYYL